MNTRELMRGDHVLIEDAYLAQVDTIGHESITSSFRRTTEGSVVSHEVPSSAVTPLSLDKFALDRFNFRLENVSGKERWCRDFGYIEVWLEAHLEHYVPVYCPDVELRFVHELQHYLRLLSVEL